MSGSLSDQTEVMAKDTFLQDFRVLLADYEQLVKQRPWIRATQDATYRLERVRRYVGLLVNMNVAFREQDDPSSVAKLRAQIEVLQAEINRINGRHADAAKDFSVREAGLRQQIGHLKDELTHIKGMRRAYGKVSARLHEARVKIRELTDEVQGIGQYRGGVQQVQMHLLEALQITTALEPIKATVVKEPEPEVVPTYESDSGSWGTMTDPKPEGLPERDLEETVLIHRISALIGVPAAEVRASITKVVAEQFSEVFHRLQRIENDHATFGPVTVSRRADDAELDRGPGYLDLSFLSGSFRGEGRGSLEEPQPRGQGEIPGVWGAPTGVPRPEGKPTEGGPRDSTRSLPGEGDD